MCVCTPCTLEFWGSHSILYIIEKPHTQNKLIPSQSHCIRISRNVKTNKPDPCNPLSEILGKMSTLRAKTFTFPQTLKYPAVIAPGLHVENPWVTLHNPSES